MKYMAEEKIAPTDLSQEEVEKDKMRAFFDEYKVLAKKHGYDIAAKLSITADGIKPTPTIIKIKKENAKSK